MPSVLKPYHFWVVINRKRVVRFSKRKPPRLMNGELSFRIELAVPESRLQRSWVFAKPLIMSEDEQHAEVRGQ
jgi:hypothetical protein